MKPATVARLLVILLCGMSLLVMSGCISSKGASGTEYDVGDVQSIEELIFYLEDMGMNLPDVRRLLDFRSIHTSASEVYYIGAHGIDGYLVAYEYSDPEVAAREARHVNYGILARIRSTVVATTVIEQYAPIYQNGHMVVVYMGTDQGMNNSMARVLGPRVLR